jgi:ABC-type phosphate/phosphonate transport system substrate-binding protein
MVLFYQSGACAAEWQKQYSEISLGVITSENEADRVERYKPVRNYLAAATWWNNESRSNMLRMEEKGMIKPGQWRIVWKSPLLPSSPWAIPTSLPEEMREDIRSALYNMPKNGPEAWQALTDGKAGGLKLVTHKDYESIVRMIQANLIARKSGS